MKKVNFVYRVIVEEVAIPDDEFEEAMDTVDFWDRAGELHSLAEEYSPKIKKLAASIKEENLELYGVYNPIDDMGDYINRDDKETYWER